MANGQVVVCDKTTTSIEFYIYNNTSTGRYYRLFVRTNDSAQTTKYDGDVQGRKYLAAYNGTYITVTGLTKGTTYAYNLGYASSATNTAGVTWCYSSAQTTSTPSSGSSTFYYRYKCYTTSGTLIKSETTSTSSPTYAPEISGYSFAGYRIGSSYPSVSTSYDSTSTAIAFTPVQPYAVCMYTTSSSGGGGGGTTSGWSWSQSYAAKLANMSDGGTTSFAFSLSAGKVGYCPFAPNVNGTITVYTTGNSDMYGYLLDADSVETPKSSASYGSQVFTSSQWYTYDDDSGDSSNFTYTYDVNSSTTYIIAFNEYYSSNAASGTLFFEFVPDVVYYTITCKDRIYNSSGTLLNTYTKGSNSYASKTTAKGSDWGTSSSYTGYYYNSCTTISSVSSNSTVYRNYYPNSYTVSYNLNGASGTAPTSTTRYYNETYTLTSTTPTRSGYNFLGWDTNSSATSGIASGGTAPASTSTSTITYYAIWQQISYTATVTYNANGGSGAPSSQSATETDANVSITLSSTKPTRDRYKFLGWSTSSSATTASYQPGTAYDFTGSSTGQTTPLYAVWEHLFGADNVYCGINGEWKLVETYYGVNGQWVPLKIYYGNGNQWKNNT